MQRFGEKYCLAFRIVNCMIFDVLMETLFLEKEELVRLEDELERKRASQGKIEMELLICRNTKSESMKFTRFTVKY